VIPLDFHPLIGCLALYLMHLRTEQGQYALDSHTRARIAGRWLASVNLE
jgi:hypothetical protein